MSDIDVLERARRAAMTVAAPDDPYEDLLRRRDRKRRNQRIAAGVVGIAVFVGALVVVTSVGVLDRSDTSVGPAGDVTGPMETGPVETGPAVSTPYDYDPAADYVGLPPEGSEPSGPERSELVAEAHELDLGWVYVFEDGRVISKALTPGAGLPSGIREQRLTSEGVELVASGVVQPADFICGEGTRPQPYACRDPLHEIPASAWEDSTLRPYVPYRYAICGAEQLERFPEAARDLLRGKEKAFYVRGAPGGKAECFDVTTEEARALDAILADAGFYIGPKPPGFPEPTDYSRWWGEALGGIPELSLTFEPILPHGDPGSQGGG